MKNTPAPSESACEIDMNNLPMPDLYQAHFLNFYAGDIVSEFIANMSKAIAKNIPQEEQMRLSKPENLVEMYSAIHSLPEVKALKKQAQKRINKRADAAMKSMIRSNPGCHSTQ